MAGLIRLGVATHNWASPVVVRTYKGKNASKELEAEAQLFALRGYAPQGQGADGGHIHVGRLLMTGGLSVLAGRGGIRSKNSITVTYARMHGDPVRVVVDHLKRGFLATSTGKNALLKVTSVDAYKSDLPVEILELVPREQAEYVVTYLTRSGVRAHIEPISGAGSGQAIPQPGRSLADEMERLGTLHRDGVFTDEEFTASKAHLRDARIAHSGQDKHEQSDELPSESGVIFCSACGARSDGSARYCSRCGEALRKPV